MGAHNCIPGYGAGAYSLPDARALRRGRLQLPPAISSSTASTPARALAVPLAKLRLGRPTRSGRHYGAQSEPARHRPAAFSCYARQPSFRGRRPARQAVQRHGADRPTVRRWAECCPAASWLCEEHRAHDQEERIVCAALALEESAQNGSQRQRVGRRQAGPRWCWRRRSSIPRGLAFVLRRGLVHADKRAGSLHDVRAALRLAEPRAEPGTLPVQRCCIVPARTPTVAIGSEQPGPGVQDARRGVHPAACGLLLAAKQPGQAAKWHSARL